jgi:hypothetical protein
MKVILAIAASLMGIVICVGILGLKKFRTWWKNTFGTGDREFQELENLRTIVQTEDLLQSARRVLLKEINDQEVCSTGFGPIPKKSTKAKKAPQVPISLADELRSMDASVPVSWSNTIQEAQVEGNANPYSWFQ